MRSGAMAPGERRLDLAAVSSSALQTDKQLAQSNNNNNNIAAMSQIKIKIKTRRRRELASVARSGMLKMLTSAGLLLLMLLLLLLLLAANGTNAGEQTRRQTGSSSGELPLEQKTLVADAKVNSNGSLQAFEELIAMGRVALATGPTEQLQQEPELSAASSATNWHWRRHQDGRLVDRIAEPTTAPQTTTTVNKLDYIVDFLRANRLSMFCDFLTNSQAPIKRLVEQLNQLKQFTLFVPTNEALLLMPSGQLEAIQSEADELHTFLMAHVTSELVVPRLMAQRSPLANQSSSLLSHLTSKYSPTGAQNRWSSGRQLERLVQATTQDDERPAVFSLAGNVLRHITIPVTSANSFAAANSSATTRLELIVNGANVLGGHSHALQEPNNTQLTYAIVHLLDRPLWPLARQTLHDKIRTQAPRFAKLLLLANDTQLVQQLKSSGQQEAEQLLTVFLPSEDSLRLLETKLLEQLETNRTYLQHFLRSHFVEGLFFATQLAGVAQEPTSAGLNRQLPRQLSSLAGLELEFETKLLQSRQLILVNGVPLLEPNQMALNGVLHSITRPIFERNRAIGDSSCNCNGAESKQLLAAVAASGQSPLLNSTQTPQLLNSDQQLLLKKFHIDDELRRRRQMASNTNENNNNNNNLNSINLTSAASTRASSSRANWFREMATPTVANEVLVPAASNGRPRDAPELEREESNSSGQSSALSPPGSGQTYNKIVRAQRSDSNLIARNNRDFYRPSTAPLNLLEESALESQSAGATRRLDANSNAMGPLGHAAVLAQQTQGSSLSSNAQQRQSRGPEVPQLSPTNFEVERYKVVLNATSRQRLREQQALIMSSAREAASGPNASQHQQETQKATNRFVYDQPLSTQRTPSAKAVDQLPLMRYAPTVASQEEAGEMVPSGRANQTGVVNQDQISSSSSTQRQQRLLLKFQAEDARDHPAPARSNFSFFEPDEQLQRLGTQSDVGAPSTPANPNNKLPQQRFGKTVAPPSGGGGGPSFNGCAFYDADCKRFVGRLVRLPSNPTGSRQQVKSFVPQQQQQQNSSLSVAPAGRVQSPAFATTPASVTFDSTFGETTENPLLFAAASGINAAAGRYSTPMTPVAQQQNRTQQFNFRPANQQLVQPAANAPLVVPTRISPLNQPLPPWSSDEEKQQQQAGSALGARGGTQTNQNWRAQELMADISRIQLSSGKLSSQATVQNFSAPPPAGQQVLMVPVRMLQDSKVLLATNRRPTSSNQTVPPIYFAPSVQQQQQQQKTGSVQQSTSFVSNAQYFTPTLQPSQPAPLGWLVNFTALELAPGSEQVKQVKQVKSPLVIQASRQRAPPAQQMDAQLQDAIKQARRIARLQTGASKQPGEDFEYSPSPVRGDISITSAKLSNRPAPVKLPSASNFTLATQASNQSPDVNLAASFLRPSAPVASEPPTSATSAEFFQNRTIAEIMDDSGLRIDGQQVTFNRLHECLERADLFKLVGQQDSAMTIFMPTDAAFQRLVQQQAQLQQRTSRSTSSDNANSQQRRHLIPLIARVANTRRPQSEEASRPSGAATSAVGDLGSSPSTALANRLTLDCSTQQARQLLLDHLSSQLVTPRQLQYDLALDSLSGKRLLLSSVPSKQIVVVDGQPVIAATRAKNGMVYVVNKFLNISQQMPSVVELLETQPNLKTFQSYMSFASLSDRLKRETGPVTVLAPTNEAFEQLSPAARQLINSDPSALMDILRGHIIEGAQFGKLISMRNRLKTMNSDHYIEAKVIKPNIYQLDNQMTSMKLVGTAGNGVVNSIDRLIVPPWLRVATGASRPQAGVASAFGRSPDSLDQVGRLETTSGQPAAAATLNLPLLNNRPLRFEQPEARLSPTSNSFALAGSTTPASGNSLDSFDSSSFDFATPPPPPPPSQGDNLSEGGLTRANNRLAQPANPGEGQILSRPAGNSSTTLAGNKNLQLIEKLAGLMRANKFVKYLLRSRLGSTLKPDMNYVLLVPTDQAMERLPKQILDMLERDQDRLSDLINFHVLDTTFEYINTIPDGQTLNTLNEKDILFNWHRNNTILTASGAVVLGGIQEENIALLVVDRVLYPTPGDLLSIVTKSPILSNFTNLIKNAGLEAQLALAGPFTLFAPSDFAFNQLDKRDFEFLLRNRDTARRFLLRHLSQPAIFTSSIALSNSTDAGMKNGPSQVPLMSITNSLGEELMLRQKNDYFSVNEVNFSYADVAATNGVVHVIDGLL